MKKYRLLRIWVKIKGIIFFLFFLIIPIIFATFLTRLLNFFYASININIIKEIAYDQLFLTSLHYIVFFVLFIILLKISKKNIDFFSKKDWFVIMGKAFMPAILAFGLGFIIIYSLFSLSELLPKGSLLSEWIKMPNHGFVIFLENIKNANHLKIILLFFYIVVLAPVYEEILFRGFLQDSIGKIFKRFNMDIIIVSLVFSFLHISSLSNALFAFIVGLFLSKQRKDSGKISISIWVHCIINFTALLSGIIFQYFENKIY